MHFQSHKPHTRLNSKDFPIPKNQKISHQVCKFAINGKNKVLDMNYLYNKIECYTFDFKSKTTDTGTY